MWMSLGDLILIHGVSFWIHFVNPWGGMLDVIWFEFMEKFSGGGTLISQRAFAADFFEHQD